MTWRPPAIPDNKPETLRRIFDELARIVNAGGGAASTTQGIVSESVGGGGGGGGGGGAGSKGDKGDQGNQGAAGPQGKQGDTGPTGPQGPTGASGAGSGVGIYYIYPNGGVFPVPNLAQFLGGFDCGGASTAATGAGFDCGDNSALPAWVGFDCGGPA